MTTQLKEYASPANEESCFKGIPMAMREIVEVRVMLATGLFKVRYRGPRRPELAGRYTCLKRDATHFSIYPTSQSEQEQTLIGSGNGPEGALTCLKREATSFSV